MKNQSSPRPVLVSCLLAFALAAGTGLTHELRRDELIQRNGWRPTGIGLLVRNDEPGCRPGHILLLTGYMPFLPMTFQANSDCTSQDNLEPSALKRIGIYSVEFGVGALGSWVSVFTAAKVSDWVWDMAGGSGIEVLSPPAGCLTYFLTSPVLTAVGTHFSGRLFGQKGKFSHALIGGAIGDVLGMVASIGIASYQVNRGYTSSFTIAAIPLVVFPSIGAVVAYNTWE